MICAATEYQGLTADDAFAAIRETIGRNTREVIRRVREEKTVPHQAALDMAFKSGNAVAVLLTQKLLGAKAF